MEEFDKDRREFIWGLGRYLLLGGLASVSGGLILKRMLASEDEKCIEPNICRSCNVFDRCDLPKALLAREKPSSKFEANNSSRLKQTGFPRSRE